MSEEQERGEVLFGVSLVDLTRVHAAERAGVPIEERLSELGLDRTAFSRAEQAWLSRLSASLRDAPALFVAYDLALVHALAAEAPKILPLEEDLGAWVSFEGHFQRATAPAEMARSAGLSLSEVARLHGAWAAKLAADPALAERAATLRAEPPSPLPTIRREPRRPPAARKEAAARPLPAEAPPAPALPSVPLDTSPATVVRVAGEPTASPALVAPPIAVRPPLVDVAPPAAPVRLPPRWDAATMEIDLSTLGATAVPFRSGVPDEQAVVRAKEHAQQMQPAPAVGDEDPGTTAEIDIRALMRPALGFGQPAALPPAAVPAAVRLPALLQPPGATAGIGTTGDVPADLLARIARGPTPFVQARPLPAPATREHDEDSITLDDEPSTAGEAPPLPFSANERPVSATRAFSGMTTDVPADLVARIAKGSAPFEPHGALKLSSTNPVTPIASAARRDRGTAAMPAAPAADPKVPFGPSAKGASPAAAQASMLTLEQHASLSAELVVFQDRTEAVFAKYGLTDVRQRLTAEQIWRERLRKNPDEEKEWRRLHQHYVAYWTASKHTRGKQ